VELSQRVGYGTTVHITAALFEQATGTRLMHVPYNSSVTSTEAVISGEVVLGASSVFTGGQAVREGRLKALAVVGDHRFVTLPSVPTFKELGYPDIVGDTWMGLLVPAGTPPAVIDKLRDTLVQVLTRPEIQVRLLAMGAEVVASTSAQFQKRMEDEVVAFKALGEKVPLTAE